MCGICGIVCEQNDKVALEILQKCSTTLTHRGPDEQNAVLIQPNVGFAHTRLSIIDLAGGKQPLCNEDQTVHIVFNGEIFNYRELTKSLQQAGHRFRTNSDTEVIVHLYEEHGTECVQYLNGQFAFAIWDSRKQMLFLARDRVGIKTIYYFVDDTKIVFASELKALTCCQEIPKNVDAKAVEFYFTYLYIPSPQTIYSGICKLPPAHCLVWRQKQLQIKQYWRIADDKAAISFADARERLLFHCEQAVTRQMVSDVPLGAFLSGGIDSSSVAFFMQKNHSQPVHTFSIRFPGASEDETEFALAVANKLATDHTVFEVTPDGSQDKIVQLLQQFDEPFGDDSAIPTYFLCKKAREHVKVCLSGDGGDELLSGYNRYRRVYRQSMYAGEPAWRKKCGHLAEIFLPQSKWAYLSRCAKLSYAQRYLQETTYFSSQEKQALFSEDFQQQAAGNRQPVEEYIGRFFASGNAPENMLHADFHTYLPEFVLTKVDRMSMMNSLEVRVPFLDHELVEFLFRLPFAYKMDARTSKLILKDAMRDKLPSAILARKKKGFGIPITYWFRNGFDKFARDIIANRQSVKHGYLRSATIDKICSGKPLAKKYNRMIWAILVFEIWLSNQQSVR